MKNGSFSKRVALSFMSATALLVLAVFMTIYGVVYHSVYSHLENDLNAESLELLNSLVLLRDEVIFANPNEWLENEHGQIEVNPTFIQYADSTGTLLRKSSNLLSGQLAIREELTDKTIFEDTIGGSRIYQLQLPVKNHLGRRMGYLSVAVPLDDTIMILKNLRTVLYLAFPIVLLLLYMISDLLASRSIAPVYKLTATARRITDKNYTERISLPQKKDELYTLTETINSLVDRLQGALQREKQFTSDASHELRTPLSVLKGNFDLTLRKKRDPEYYEEKIRTGLREIDRISLLVDQLLLLARYEKDNDIVVRSTFNLQDLVFEQLSLLNDLMEEKSLHPVLDLPSGLELYTDRFMLGRIVENLLNNAIKYSADDGQIVISAATKNETVRLMIRDHGCGIEKEEQNRIFDRFYRSDSSRNGKISGHGLGLSIVRRFSDMLHIGLELESEEGKGTQFTLLIPERKNARS